MFAFSGKTVLLGVTGGIAAYKAAQLVSDLKKQGAEVFVLMTRNAAEFVTPTTFETLSGNRVCIDTFDRNFQWNVEHVALAKRADVAVVAPATANVIAKLACGLADDMLTTTLLAARCPKIVCPAMNTGMYENRATQRNLQQLREDGFILVEPEEGHLACGDSGKGRLAGLPGIEQAIAAALRTEQDLQGVRITVTAGPTCEAIDPVRYITNHSSGKMGYAIAQAAAQRGAAVTLVSGPVALPPPEHVTLVRVTSAQQMFEAVRGLAQNSDILIKAAAVADYTPVTVADQKMKKQDGELTIELRRTQDILKYLGEHKRPGQLLCGFSMETENLVVNSTKKLISKQADLIVANNLRDEGAGFGVDTNVVTLITRDGAQKLEQMSKQQLAHVILDRLAAMRCE